MTIKRSLFMAMIGPGILLTGCDKSKPAREESALEAEITAKVPDGTTDSPQQLPKASWSDILKARELVQSGRQIADKALISVNIEELKSRIQGLVKTLGSGDFDEAEKIADKLGKSLDSGSIGACVRVLKIKSARGSEAAREEILKFQASVDLSPEEKKFLKDLHGKIETMDAEERINAVTLVTVIACEAKLGHGGGAAGALFGDFLREAFNVKPKTQNQEKAGERTEGTDSGAVSK